jgi:Ras-related protein Rab-7A
MKKKINIIVIGDGEVGKTSLLNNYSNKRFTNQHIKTVGVDFIKKNIVIEGTDIEIKLWDTAGQERFKTITYQFYR